MRNTAPAVVTIGNFDGVHLGHQHLLQTVVQRARELDLQACAVTFDPHPRAVLRPDLAPLNLTPVPEKVRRMREAGLDDVWVCRFTREIAQMEPEGFLDLIEQRWPIAELMVGHDFALGRGRSGSLDVLREIGAERGFSLRVVEPLCVAGEVVSSSRIRSLLAEGRHAEATQLIAA
jgi:riboflavin kinase / FMN adenylyltransferase